ncbi:UPF0132 domain protein [Rutstroemia sp. NJR-2017a BBW]|nr:UPF0132 domain protein [Rutstroemia sp. NJR-2017a BBW]
MDFAPYQESPEATRALSPSPRNSTSSPRPSMSPTRRSFSPGVRSPAFLQSASNNISKNAAVTPNPWAQTQERNGYFPDLERGDAGRTGGREGLHEFETSLPLRLDYEACLAYLLLPPVGGVLLLVAERKSDYVSLILCVVMGWRGDEGGIWRGVVRTIWTIWFHAWQSALLFSAMFVVHLVFSWILAADTLDRCEVPFFGRLASSILDDE